MKKVDRKTRALAIAIITLLIVGILLLFADKANIFNRGGSEVADTTQEPEERINLDTPTEEEKNAGEAIKEGLVANGSSENQNSTTVYPVISTWNQNTSNDLEVSGFVPGIVENGGKCTLVLERNNQKVTAQRDAVSDAQSTICGIMNIQADKLSQGQWNAILYYESANYKGQSDNLLMEIKK